MSHINSEILWKCDLRKGCFPYNLRKVMFFSILYTTYPSRCEMIYTRYKVLRYHLKSYKNLNKRFICVLVKFAAFSYLKLFRSYCTLTISKYSNRLLLGKITTEGINCINHNHDEKWIHGKLACFVEHSQSILNKFTKNTHEFQLLFYTILFLPTELLEKKSSLSFLFL